MIRFPLGIRNVEEVMAECGIDFRRETIRY